MSLTSILGSTNAHIHPDDLKGGVKAKTSEEFGIKTYQKEQLYGLLNQSGKALNKNQVAEETYASPLESHDTKTTFVMVEKKDADLSPGLMHHLN